MNNVEIPVITEAVIIPMDMSKGRYQAQVMAQFSDGEIRDVFAYYTDELFFYPSDFIGHTMQWAHDLFTSRDIAYLRS